MEPEVPARTQLDKFEQGPHELETDDNEASDEKMRKPRKPKPDAQDNVAKGRKGG